MQELAAVPSVRQAVRMLKQMDMQAPEWGDYREAGRVALSRVIEERMHGLIGNRLAELEAAGIADRRNGSYGRQLLSSLGPLELQVPRTRTFSPTGVLQAYARRERWIDRVILACFVLGLSTRKVGKALLPILGERVSPATVSRVAQTLDTAVEAFHRRPLANRYRVLLLDGVVLSRKTGGGALRRPVLVAMGITLEGKKEILDFRLAPAESQAAWEAFLNDLHARGLTGEGLALIVTDGGAGLLAALPLVYPRVPVGRCWAHKTRNVLDKVRLADRERVKRDLHRISHAAHRVEARRAARRLTERWSRRYPAAVRCLLQDLEALLEFLRFQDLAWRQAARTTNAIERRFREVRRRTRPMGVFSDRTSMERILFAVFTHENEKAGTSTLFLVEPGPHPCQSGRPGSHTVS
ncbi:MAG TPA: IS256 family transposase [Candidatus Dormibacteraeota bacterium]|nr:IS256 family transposase [Candidatus Dormibacteraeota bacterium]